MKALEVLICLSGLLLVQSCTQSPLPQQEPVEEILLSTRSCNPDIAYMAGLKTFLAGVYDVDEVDIAVSYLGSNAQGEHGFPFTVSQPSNDLEHGYLVDDLCLDYAVEFIVEEDLAGF